MTKICELSSRLSRWSGGVLSEPCCTPEGFEKACFCVDHGCRVCEYVNSKKGVKNNLEEEFCSEDCRDKSESNLFNRTFAQTLEEKERKKELAKKVEKMYNVLQEKFKERFTCFYEHIKGIDLDSWKREFIEGKIEVQKFLSDWHMVIELSSLESDEKRQWKEIYSESNCIASLAPLVLEERSFLLSLAKQKKEQAKKEKNGKEEIIRELKQEFNFFSPRVELNELPEIYRDYESLKYEELKLIKASIIEEIRNKREEKKLSALFIKANACVDDELREFIRKLEKYTWEYASKHKKNSYNNQRIQVDEVIGGLWDRLDDLNEKLSLISLQADVCHNFDEWIKEGENLSLSDNCPYREFKENVKSIKDRALLLSQQNQVYQSIVEEFKNVVKKQIGAEKLGSGSQIIDKGKSFTEVKLAREIIKLLQKTEINEKLGSSREEIKKFKFIEGEVNKLKNDFLNSNNQEINLSEVNALVEKLKEEIRNTKLDKSQKQEESRPNSSSWLSLHWKKAGVIIAFAFFLVTLVFLIIKKRKRNV